MPPTRNFPSITPCSKFLLSDSFGFAELHVQGALKFVQKTGFKDSTALASVMSAKHEQIRSQNMKKRKTGKKEKTKGNEIKGAKEKENQLFKIVIKEIMCLFPD